MGNQTNLYRELIKYPNIISFLKGTSDLQELFSLLPNISKERILLYESLYNSIGNTPVVKINLTNRNLLYVKQECENGLGNNHYSRYWIIHLALAESLGLIEPKKTTILEISSGSSGIALSMACELLGYSLRIIVPEMLPKGRIEAMESDCTTIIKVPGYLAECKRYFMEEKNKYDFYIPNHSEEKADLITDVFSRIAVEFYRDYGNVDNAILGLGNGSSTYSVGKTLKKYCPKCKVFSFYPSLTSGKVVYGLYADNLSFIHIIKAQKEGLVYKDIFTDEFLIDEVAHAFSQQPIITQWGHSSLFAIDIANKLAEHSEGESFFTIAYDKIERYHY